MRKSHASVSEQPVQHQRQAQPDQRLDQIGGEAQPHQRGVRHQVCRGGPGISRDVHLQADHVSEPAEHGDHQVQQAGLTGEADVIGGGWAALRVDS